MTVLIDKLLNISEAIALLYIFYVIGTYFLYDVKVHILSHINL